MDNPILRIPMGVLVTTGDGYLRSYGYNFDTSGLGSTESDFTLTLGNDTETLLLECKYNLYCGYGCSNGYLNRYRCR